MLGTHNEFPALPSTPVTGPMETGNAVKINLRKVNKPQNIQLRPQIRGFYRVSGLMTLTLTRPVGYYEPYDFTNLERLSWSQKRSHCAKRD